MLFNLLKLELLLITTLVVLCQVQFNDACFPNCFGRRKTKASSVTELQPKSPDNRNIELPEIRITPPSEPRRDGLSESRVRVSSDLGSNGLSVSTTGTIPEPSYNEPGLFIRQWIDFNVHTRKTAIVYYDNKPGFLKCVFDGDGYKNEVSALEKIRSADRNIIPDARKSIVELYHNFITANEYCVVLSYGGHMTLADYAMKLGSSSRARFSLSILSQILHGVVFLHRVGITHNDIKSQNILVRLDARNQNPLITIIDFDLSAPLVRDDHGYALPIYFHPGTDGYDSPERRFADSLDGTKLDSWSIAATMYDFLTGILPYNYVFRDGAWIALKLPEYIDVMRKVYNSGVNTMVEIEPQGSYKHVAISVVNIIKELFTVDPVARPEPMDILSRLPIGYNLPHLVDIQKPVSAHLITKPVIMTNKK